MCPQWGVFKEADNEQKECLPRRITRTVSPGGERFAGRWDWTMPSCSVKIRNQANVSTVGNGNTAFLRGGRTEGSEGQSSGFVVAPTAQEPVSLSDSCAPTGLGIPVSVWGRG